MKTTSFIFHLDDSEIECLLSGTLPADEKKLADLHLEVCARCSKEFSDLKQMYAEWGFEVAASEVHSSYDSKSSVSPDYPGPGSSIDLLSAVWEAFQPLQPAWSLVLGDHAAEEATDLRYGQSGLGKQILLSEKIDAMTLRQRTPWAGSIVKFVPLSEKEPSSLLASVERIAGQDRHGTLRISVDDIDGRHSEVRLTAAFPTDRFPDALNSQLLRATVTIEKS